MAVTFSLNVFRGDLASIVQSVFRTMMDMEVEAAAAPWIHPPDTLTAAVHFVGEWRGATLVECGAQPARQFAQHFMGIPLPPAIDDDVRDVMGELANMVAGNFLSNLADAGLPCHLTAPIVYRASEFVLRSVPGGVCERMVFRSPEAKLFLDISVNPWND